MNIEDNTNDELSEDWKENNGLPPLEPVSGGVYMPGMATEDADEDRLKNSGTMDESLLSTNEEKI